MATITANTGATSWNTNAAWVGGVQPTAADDVVIPASAVVTIPSAVTALGRSCTVQTSGTLVFAATTSTLTLGDGTAGAGNVAFSNAGTITRTANGTINFVSTAAASTQTITAGGQNLANITINTGSTTTIQLADALTCNTLTWTTGTFDSASKTITCVQLSSGGSGTRTVNLGTSNITISGGTTQAFGVNNASNMTFNASTSTMTFTGASVTLNAVPAVGTAYAFGTVIFSGSGLVTLSTSSTPASPQTTFVNLTRTGTAVTTDGIAFSRNITISGTLTLTGNSLTNRVLAQITTVGNPVTITAAAIALTNVDFQDIVAAGLPANAAWTGTSMGDCLGNTNITFDSPVTQTHTASAGGNWSDVTKWTSRVPLPQDNVVVNGNTTGTLTADMPRVGANLTMTGFTGTFNGNSLATITTFGSITLPASGSLINMPTYVLQGRGAQTLTSAGNNFPSSLRIDAPTGSYSLQDALAISSTLDMRAGTFNAVTFDVTCGVQANFTNTATGGRTVNMGSGNWKFNNNSTSSPWNMGTTTLNAQTSTITIATASANTRTFVGNGKTYNVLTYTVANSPGQLVITGANTFGTINVGPGTQLQLPSSTTNTVTNWNVSGQNNGYLYLPGGLGNYASAPDSAALSITGDIDIRVKVALDNWTASAPVLVCKADNVTTQASYQFSINTAPNLLFLWSSNGVAWTVNTSSTASLTGLVNGQPTWLRATRNGTTGDINFYKSSDGIAWTQVGATKTGLSTAAMFDSTSALGIGADRLGTIAADILPGKMYLVDVRNNILDNGTGIQFSADFTAKAFGANSFTESSSNSATVTINGTAAQAGDGRVAITASASPTAATLAFQSRAVSDYITVQDNTATTTTPAYAGANGVLVSGDTNWLATAAPGGSNLMMLGVG